jgi:hypothetical protein
LAEDLKELALLFMREGVSGIVQQQHGSKSSDGLSLLFEKFSTNSDGAKKKSELSPT